MLNYLATALPGETGADARMLALQCALRMNNSAEVRLPYGVLRSLRLESATDSCRELIEAGLLRPVSSDRVVVLQMLDPGLLTQHPARPDRLRAADWALRSACLARTSPAPLLRLAALSIVVRTSCGSDQGVAETEQLARECGVHGAALSSLLEQLVTAEILTAWQTVSDTGELTWKMGPKGPHPHSSVEDTQ
ncbi:hypothetical protein ABK046_15140 [Streptomyces caeruleatus]